MINNREQKIQEAKENLHKLLSNHSDVTPIFLGITGSVAYGTDLPSSDVDLKGVYIQNLEQILKGRYKEQVGGNKTSKTDGVDERDVTLYEIQRYLELVGSNNPNILELMNLPEDCILYKHPVWDIVNQHKDQLVTKKTRGSFYNYAYQQIKKARGYNKKVVQKVDKERKTPLDFIYYLDHVTGKSTPIQKWMDRYGYENRFIGLVNVPNSNGIYMMFYDLRAFYCFSETIPESLREINKSFHDKKGFGFKGIINPENLESNQLRTSSIPKDIPTGAIESLGLISYNQDGYTIYCKKYREYWEWVEERNEERFRINEEHGKGYDSKNLMHCIRLLQMANEIAETGKIVVRRPNREELLSVRLGDMEYDDLIKWAEELSSGLDEKFKNYY